MITQDQLKRVMSYDHTTGIFRWAIKPRQRSRPAMGSEAGGINTTTGYKTIQIDGRRYQAHRLAWLYMTGEWPIEDIDHINNNKADNRFENLRQATRSQNHHNKGPMPFNTSGYKGVTFHKGAGKWMARVADVDGSQIYLGLFPTPEAAYEAYCHAAKRLHGEFARLR